MMEILKAAFWGTVNVIGQTTYSLTLSAVFAILVLIEAISQFKTNRRNRKSLFSPEWPHVWALILSHYKAII